jgi:hypothetical protein
VPIRVRPQTLEDEPEPESDLSSDEEGSINGLRKISFVLGSGAVLYLQIMKSMAVMFFILSVLNVPIYLMYSSSTINNDYLNLNSGLRFFTIGNLAQRNSGCGTIPITFKEED